MHRRFHVSLEKKESRSAPNACRGARGCVGFALRRGASGTVAPPPGTGSRTAGQEPGQAQDRQVPPRADAGPAPRLRPRPRARPPPGRAGEGGGGVKSTTCYPANLPSPPTTAAGPGEGSRGVVRARSPPGAGEDTAPLRPSQAPHASALSPGMALAIAGDSPAASALPSGRAGSGPLRLPRTAPGSAARSSGKGGARSGPQMPSPGPPGGPGRPPAPFGCPGPPARPEARQRASPWLHGARCRLPTRPGSSRRGWRPSSPPRGSRATRPAPSRCQAGRASYEASQTQRPCCHGL